ncbi:hypothetical protein ABMA27_013820 [Loxostege sticticalis]|uniref:THAP-type domain-containing protein n=1 Tax=Loxostege sticticalis TaxID=481309 RepID=A0ABR3IBQ2_LOXSC
MPSCVVKWCKNNSNDHSKSHGITFHIFPHDPVRKRRWMKAVQLERHDKEWMPSNGSKICSIHFKDDDFYLSKKGFQMLKKDAVPICTIHLPPNIATTYCHTNIINANVFDCNIDRKP